MVRGEEVMPVPGGEITGSEIWVTPAPEPEVVQEVVQNEPCECDDGCEGCKE